MTFRYQHRNILNLKEKQKEQAHAEFGLFAKKKDLMAEELNSYIQERDNRLHEWEQADYLTSVSVIQQRSQYLSSLNEKIAQANVGLKKAEDLLKEKQHEFLEKKKEEQIWLHLREKSYETYLQKEKKEEQDQLDEMATIRYYHQRLSRI